MKTFFVETKTAKKEPLTFRNFYEALKIEDNCYNLLFRPLHELQMVDYNEKNLYDFFDNFSTTLKNQLVLHFPETR